MRRLAVTALVLLAVLPAARADTLDALMERGRRLIESGRYEEARRQLERGRSAAEETQDTGQARRFVFQLALAWQREGTGLPADDERRPAALRRAVRLYKQLLEQGVGAGSVHHNLAQVYWELGDEALAARHFESALGADDGRRAFYAKNYGDAFAAMGDWRTAERAYRVAVEARPQAREVHDILMEHYANDPDGLTRYLWELNDAGQVVRAQQEALGALERPGMPARAREELLALVAAGLSGQYFDLQSFAGSETARRLEALAEDPGIGEGVKQLLALVRGESWHREQFGWWAHRGDPLDDPPVGEWPNDAFRALARSIADKYRAAGAMEPAEACLRMAATLLDHDPDPKAYEGLAELYVAGGRLDELERMIDRIEGEIFAAKGDAYRRSQERRILDFHRTLGKIYGHLGRWGDSDTPTSAIFQLEHAREFAGRVESHELDAARAEPLFDDDLAVLLAAGYEAVGRADEAVEVRLQTAERYRLAGEPETSRRLLVDLDAETLPVESRKLYLELMRTVPEKKLRERSDGR